MAFSLFRRAAVPARQSPIRVQTLEEFNAAVCSRQHPICILPRTLPFDFEKAARFIGSSGYSRSNGLMAFQIEKMIASNKDRELDQDTKEALEFLIEDLKRFKDKYSEPMLRYIPASGYSNEDIHEFHFDHVSQGAHRTMCSYIKDTGTESIDRADVLFISGSAIQPRLGARVESTNAGDITKHNDDWLHRAPRANCSRLLLVA